MIPHPVPIVGFLLCGVLWWVAISRDGVEISSISYRRHFRFRGLKRCQDRSTGSRGWRRRGRPPHCITRLGTGQLLPCWAIPKRSGELWASPVRVPGPNVDVVGGGAVTLMVPRLGS